MIRKYINEYDHYQCSNCGEETYEDADYCQVCGHEFHSVRNETDLENTASDNETMCIAIGATKAGIFTFAQLKIEKTPRMLLNLPSFQNQRMMAEANPYEFFVFKTANYPYLGQGVQVNLNLGNYNYFETPNGFKIYYDKTQFKNGDVQELKTYNFQV